MMTSATRAPVPNPGDANRSSGGHSRRKMHSMSRARGSGSEKTLARRSLSFVLSASTIRAPPVHKCLAFVEAGINTGTPAASWPADMEDPASRRSGGMTRMSSIWKIGRWPGARPGLLERGELGVEQGAGLLEVDQAPGGGASRSRRPRRAGQGPGRCGPRAAGAAPGPRRGQPGPGGTAAIVADGICMAGSMHGLAGPARVAITRMTTLSMSG